MASKNQQKIAKAARAKGLTLESCEWIPDDAMNPTIKGYWTVRLSNGVMIKGANVGDVIYDIQRTNTVGVA